MFRNFKKWITLSKENGKDIVIFTMSLLLAFSIWMIHELSLRYTELVIVPVKVQASINGHSSMSSNSNIISARCRTTGFDIIRLSRDSHKKPKLLNLDKGDIHYYKGELYYVTATDLNRYIQPIFGDKVYLDTFISDTLFFRFPFENSKKVPVEPMCRISYAPQYMNVGNMKMVPDSVYIYGEPAHLDNIDKVYTESFSLENLKIPAHGTVKLDKIKGIRISDEIAEYNLDVRRYVELKAEMPIVVKNVPKDHKLIVHPGIAKVLFKCAFPISTNPLNKVQFYIDYNDFETSINGNCMVHISNMPESKFEYSIEPEIFNCVESIK
jgi:hypothetical protein